MSKSKFSKPPVLDKSALEEKADSFIEQGRAEPHPNAPPKKTKTKALFLRIPKPLWVEIHSIAATRGLSVNAVCSEILRKNIEQSEE